MIDWNKPIRTRDGRKVRIICKDRKLAHFPIVALISALTDTEETALISYSNDGRPRGACSDSPLDLVNVPEKLAVYVNVYKAANNLYVVGHPTKEIADRDYGTARLTCVKIEVEV